MTRVHPNVHPPSFSLTAVRERKEEEEVMTVWRKSLMFNCDGFTVFDARGDLRFRVDNYSGGRRKAEIVLMDATGKSILTLRRKRLSLTENWLIYKADESVNHVFSVKKHVTLLHSKKLAHVTPRGIGRSRQPYAIQGLYMYRQCIITDNKCQAVGEVRRKEAAVGVTLGGDVFRLVVKPGLDTAVAMAMVMVLEQMYG